MRKGSIILVIFMLLILTDLRQGDMYLYAMEKTEYDGGSLVSFSMSGTEEEVKTLQADEQQNLLLEGREVAIEKIELSTNSIVMYEGESYPLKVRKYPHSSDETYRISTSAPSVVSVSQDGVIRAVKRSEQPVQIYVKSSNASAECTVYVRKPDYEKYQNQSNTEMNITDGIWIFGFQKSGYVYDGTRKLQKIRIFDGKKRLQEGKDYQLFYSNCVKASTNRSTLAPSVTIRMMGQYKGVKKLIYDIEPKELSLKNVATQHGVLSYTGKIQKFNPYIQDGGKRLKKNVDYRIEYQSVNLIGNKNEVLRIPIEVYGIGNYTGKITGIDYEIVPNQKNLSNAKIRLGLQTYRYQGNDINPEELGIQVKIANSKQWVSLEALKDEIMAEVYCDYRNVPCKAVVIVRAKENSAEYIGSVHKEFEVIGYKNIKLATITDVWKEQLMIQNDTLDGKVVSNGKFVRLFQQETKGLLKDGSYQLEEGKDFTIRYENADKAGTATAVIKGIGMYTGAIRKSYRIVPDQEFIVDIPENIPYCKSGAIPKVTVYDCNGSMLRKGTDYKVILRSNRQPGIAYFEIIGKGAYHGVKMGSGTFTVLSPSLKECRVIVKDRPYQNTENAYLSIPRLFAPDGTQLIAGIDYIEKYEYYFDGIENTKIPVIGTEITVTITGKGVYQGTSVSESYHIYGKQDSISNLYFRVDSCSYTGKPIEPQIYGSTDAEGPKIHVYYSAKDRDRNKNEMIGASQFVKVLDYKNNLNAGKGKIILQGNGIYGGTKTVSFQIDKKIYSNKSVSKVRIDQSSVLITKGDSILLKASVEPDSVEDRSVFFTTSDPNIAVIHEQDSQNGIASIKGITSGACTITAISRQDQKKTASCQVYVQNDSKDVVTVKVTDYGAIANDGKDDALAFKMAIEDDQFGEVGKIIIVPEGVYDINTDTTNPSEDRPNGITIWGMNNVHIELEKNAVLRAMRCNDERFDVVRFVYASNCSINGGRIEGNRYHHDGNSGEWGHGIAVYAGNSVHISNMTIEDNFGDGIWVGDDPDCKANPSRNVVITNCMITNNRRNNISLTCANQIKIVDCRLTNANGTDPQFGLDIETNYTNVPCTDIYVKGTTIEGNQNGAVGIITPAKNITFDSCVIRGPVYDMVHANPVYINTVRSD